MKNIDISPLYEVLNSVDVLTAYKMVYALPQEIPDRFVYDSVNESLIMANKAIKMIESKRKEITGPLDDLKKEIMAIERPIIDDLKKFVDFGKSKMLAYNIELERKQVEANNKLKIEAEELLKNSTPDLFATLAGYFIDESIQIKTQQPENIRITKKAELEDDVLSVDWQMVVECLIRSGNFNYELLLKDLYKSMQAVSINYIKGIEIVEHKTQIVR